MLEIDYKPIDDLFDLKNADFRHVFESEDYHKLHAIFDEKYNISDYEFSFDISCTHVINRLFDEYVTENTIVICSCRDHPSVHKCLQAHSCTEKIFLDEGPYVDLKDNEDLVKITKRREISARKLSKRLSNKNYENIFFISYGTHVSNGEFRDNKYFQRLFHILDEHCTNVTKVLDDCQGSVWIDRDYTLFDYVLWTAHATIQSFDVGILLSSPKVPALGVHHVGEEYLYNNYLNLIKNKTFAMSWNKQLSLATGVHLSEAPHIFNLELTKDYPEEYFNDLQMNNDSVSDRTDIKIDANRFIRLRVERYMKKTGKFLLLRALRYIYAEREFIKA